ncbi:enoyl-CoA hydratase-related protein [Tomitella cavernea]|uniref:Enoyl-CoA hydratase n=1 Tax=Tomitella cavernea TaxID=1387982 RepID=A0ABP9D342_9ACTN|nr:enoyl-CoA hydratase-related protein [Tomitella cavernea]
MAASETQAGQGDTGLGGSVNVYASAPNAPVLAELRGAVLLLTLNRPDKLNAWNNAMEDRYLDLLETADADPAVAAVVVTGAGRGFCSGADLGGLRHAGERTADDIIKPRARDTARQLRKPLIGAINGAVAGFGLAQALYFDVRFAARTARFTTAFARRGLIAEYGTTVMLTDLVGRSRAADLLLSARMVEAEEAWRIGLVDHLAGETGPEVVAAAVSYAADLAAHCSPRSMAAIKRQLRRDVDGAYPGAAARAEPLMLQAFHSPDSTEGVASHLERRAPRFPPLPPRPEGETPATEAGRVARAAGAISLPPLPY